MDIATIAFSSSLTLSMIILMFVVYKNRMLKKKIKILKKTYESMQNLIDFKNSKITSEDVHKENFIKFLSDSRDSAYEYIENVQAGLEKFVSEVDAPISYFDEYGEVLSVHRPDYEALVQISKAYKELKKLLPVEEDK